MSIFAPGSFVNDANATPQEIARKRALIAAMMPQYGKARYVGEGVGQLFTGIASGRRERALSRQEEAGRAGANDIFSRIMARAGQRSAPESGAPMATWTPEPPPRPTDLDFRNPDVNLGFGGIKPDNYPQPVGEVPLGPDAMGMAQMRGLDPSFPAPVGDKALGYGDMQPSRFPTPVGEARLGMPEMAPQGADAVFRAELLESGLPAHVVDGILMNAKDESAFNPQAVGDNGAAFGLLQWNGPRKAALQKFAADRGLNPADPRTQAQFTVFELQGPEAAAGRALLSTSTPGEAAAVFLNKFERPAEVHRARREAAYLGGAAPSGAGAPSGAPSGGVQMAQADDMAIMEALANPWLAPEQRAVLADILAQKRGAPMQALDLERAQLEVERLRNGGGAGAPAGFRELEMRAQASGLQPGTPEYQQFMLSGGGGIREGRPAAFEALHQQALAAGLEPGTDGYKQFMLTKGAGEVARAREVGTQSGEAAVALPATLATAEQALGLIDSIMNDPALPEITGMIQGRLPPLTQRGTDLNVKIEQLQGKAFLEAFESLKGAGQITEVEGIKAERAIARLARAQSTEAYKAAMQELRDVIGAGMQRARQKAGQPAAPQGGATLRFNPETGELE